MDAVDKRLALIHKSGSRLYPYKKRQIETNRYGFALTDIGEGDRHGGGTYTDDIELVVKRLIFDKWNVRAKSADSLSKKLEGSYGIGKLSIIGYELDESLWHLIESSTEKPKNYRKTEPASSFKSTATPSVLVDDAVVDEFALRAIKTRRGQKPFRDALLMAFDNSCCISGSSVISVLEAAHIVPHSDETDYSILNGLLLRADIHTLYDLNLIGIDEHGIVHISNELTVSEYSVYDGKQVLSSIPADMKRNLQKRFERFSNKPRS